MMMKSEYQAIKSLNEKLSIATMELASAIDLLNCWCREEGVTECSSHDELKNTIDRLWDKISGTRGKW